MTDAGYVHVYGRDAPEKLMQRIVSMEEEHARLLDTLPPHQHSHFRHRHISASSAPGALHRLSACSCRDMHACYRQGMLRRGY